MAKNMDEYLVLNKGNPIEKDGKVVLYTRGEAIAKAKEVHGTFRKTTTDLTAQKIRHFRLSDGDMNKLAVIADKKYTGNKSEALRQIVHEAFNNL